MKNRIIKTNELYQMEELNKIDKIRPKKTELVFHFFNLKTLYILFIFMEKLIKNDKNN